MASRSASIVVAAMAQPGSALCASSLSALNLESTSPDAPMFAALNLEYMSPEAQAKLVRRRRIQMSVERHSTRRTLLDVWQQWQDTVQPSPWCIARDEHSMRCCGESSGDGTRLSHSDPEILQWRDPDTGAQWRSSWHTDRVDESWWTGHHAWAPR